MRKGLSPLIATVLLIAFVIAAAGILANFAIPFTRERSEDVTQRATADLQCSYANIFIKEAKYGTNPNNLSITVENVGRETLEKFKATIIRTNNTASTIILAPTSVKMLPGDIEILTNSTHVGSCSDISSVIVRSDTCPTDAKDEIKKASIASCS